MNKMTKVKLIEEVYNTLLNDIKEGDSTVLYELLSFIPVSNLIEALPENEWKKYEHLRQ